MKQHIVKVGITHGDINGIGYEVIMKALLDNRIMENCTPIVYGSPKVAAYHRKALNINNFSFNHINAAEEAVPKRPNIINCIDENIRVELGKSTKMAGEASYMALEAAVKDIKEGKIDVLITAPINKENIQSNVFHFPGHTQYLAEEFKAEDHLMLMVSNDLKVGIVTEHIPLSKVASTITTDMILSKLRVLNRTLMEDFTLHKPRIAVLALNPHAGDHGLIGDEEEREIIPAIKTANEEGIIAMGPYPADGFFGSADYKKFDAILAMYHDQGLTPFKLASFESGVNFTAGLPIVRTSPGHGTAYSLAGEGNASEDSFRNAMYLAIDLFLNREQYKEFSKDPLQSQEIDRTGGE
ncbi:4-hydroxythreonine-4-phosphate dehydrogenase PdxA [Prolixibacter sp. NT017]|uniref:4-hydroxythreonine-4-phosphate dehydrogenase PdxA n=1 Tax=Prolixibacter sp. NT017 TaxID=2652390 RepID=UPI00126F823F|nr:4-hydroxythreonine-4-phosphate dehydrogenase PdxA [Prolixibacter sp. NT017]GET27416.1 4-hydroxythreonine-4-phosphate dehydrogenase [Prolixibacter sp. NT017]